MSNSDDIDRDNVLDEDEELMPNSNATSSSRRGKRSTAKCNKTAQKIAAGKALKIEFDELGVPTGDNATEFTRNIALKTRDMIPISYKRWPSVPKELKMDLLAAICTQWNIPSNSPHLKKILSTCSTRWRAYKCRLNKRYRLNPKEGEEPWDAHNIAKEEFEAFDEYYGSSEFEELSKKGKENAAKKDMPHTLGSGGYMSAEKTWKKGEVVHGATSTISEEVDSRSYRWGRARARRDPETNELRCTDPKVAKIIDTAVAYAESGEFKASRQNDILTSAIGTKEHSGRLRGYPQFTGVKKVFGKGTRKSKGYSKEELDRRVQEEVSRQVQEEIDQRVQREVARVIEQNFSRMWPHGPPPPPHNYDPITNQAFILLSQGSNNQPHPIPGPGIQGSMEALLFLPGDNLTINYVARAIVFARNSMDETVHGEPLGKEELRVQLLEVFHHAYESSPPFPPPNSDDRLGMLVNSFLRWPSFLVDTDLSRLASLRQTPQQPALLAKNTGKKKIMQQVEEEPDEVDEDFDADAFLVDGEIKMRDPFCTPEELQLIGPNAAEVHNYMLMVDPSASSFEIHAKFDCVVLDSFILSFSDIEAIFKRRMLIVQVMKVWTMWARDYCKEVQLKDFRFMDPERNTGSHAKSDPPGTLTYLTTDLEPAPKPYSDEELNFTIDELFGYLRRLV
ncbi:hypothetical protein LUZ61_018925 [Rhynchospora tenuis]|uniref:Uncharacterized protein n=1 Tax=Rhynchospora tenuis TaxID=198213 RepID=A0AAD5Z7H8_9POAL|nr:hypothetical protein LUZ61_017444 [Rhynchospora tenuis]KAJ3689761.1 hypothetical protein LUZ61_018925 [Rhynchospora tenuis]